MIVQKGSIALRYIIGFVLMIAATSVAISMMLSLQDNDAATDHHIINTVKDAPDPVCDEYGWQQRITPDDLKKIMYATYTGNCGSGENTTITLGFTLSNLTAKQYITSIGLTDSDGDAIAVFRDSCSQLPSLEGVVYGGVTSDQIIYERGTVVNISRQGASVHICR